MTRATLLALADQVEALSGPDREVDALICAAISPSYHYVRSARLGNRIGTVVQYYDSGSHGSLMLRTSSAGGVAKAFRENRAEQRQKLSTSRENQRAPLSGQRTAPALTQETSDD